MAGVDKIKTVEFAGKMAAKIGEWALAGMNGRVGKGASVDECKCSCGRMK